MSNKWTLISFVTLWMRSEGNARKNGEPTVGLSFTTMLQRTGRFRFRISYRRNMWQHWSIPYNLLDWLQLILNFCLDQNQRWRDGAFVMALTSLRMQRKSWKDFHKMTSRNYLYCCTVHLVDSLIITQPTNALIVCHLFLNHFFKTLSLLLHVSIAYRLSSSGSTYSS